MLFGWSWKLSYPIPTKCHSPNRRVPDVPAEDPPSHYDNDADAGGSCGEEFGEPGESQHPQEMEPSQSDHEGSDGDSILSKTTLVLGEQSGGEDLDSPGEGCESENDDVEDPVVPPQQSDDELSSDWEEGSYEGSQGMDVQGNSRWPQSHYDNHIRSVLMNFWDSGKKSWCTSHILWPEYTKHCEWSFAHFGPPAVGWLSISKHFQLWLDHYMAQEN